MRRFGHSEELRPDIKVNGLESWLISQLRQAFLALGDTNSRPFWENRRRDTIQLVQTLSDDLLFWAENCWLVYAGLYNGVSLGTLQLIQSVVNDLFNDVWDLSRAADTAMDEWKNIISYFRCEELKPEIRAPENPLEYVRNPTGMKVEARGIRYKYDPDDEEEVLKGASFIINPGAMVAVVGYSPLFEFTNSVQTEPGSPRS